MPQKLIQHLQCQSQLVDSQIGTFPGVEISRMRSLVLGLLVRRKSTIGNDLGLLPLNCFSIGVGGNDAKHETCVSKIENYFLFLATSSATNEAS